MKILTKEEADAHYNVVLKGGAKGAAYSSAVTIPLSFYLHKVWPYYRSLPISLKALGVVTIVGPVTVTVAELDGNAWERARWNDPGARELHDIEKRELERQESLSGVEKWRDWAAQRRYTIVGASWALSMALASAIVFRNPYQTFPQKIVQARMWAQGLTVGVLVASAGLATTDSRTGAAHPQQADHSWALILEEQEKDRLAQKEGKVYKDTHTTQ